MVGGRSAVDFSRSWSLFSRFFRDFSKKFFRALKRCFCLFSVFFRTCFARAITTSLKKGGRRGLKNFLRKVLTADVSRSILTSVNRTGAQPPDRLTGAASRIIAGVGRPV